MNPPIRSRQPLSHEWRRHSLVRVRRPVWSGHTSAAAAPEGAPAQVANGTPQTTSSQTTYDDIAW
ncbi:MAG TPA: hypothetical protein VI039_09800 [Solirubrobacterales bacterium]